MLVYKNFIDDEVDENGCLKSISFHPPVTYNFGFDVVDAVADKTPDKLAMLWVSRFNEEKRFTFSDIKKYSNKTANYFKKLGIKKGDRVLLVLKRHYQFWFAITALHKIGAIAIPATFLLTKKDFVYRFNAAGVKAVVATSENDIPNAIDAAEPESPTLKIKCIVNGTRDGWSDFDKRIEDESDVFPRPTGEDEVMINDLALMYFTSGTTGYPKIAAHDGTYSLGHLVTARYWHNIDPEGLHLTISDTGWGKAVWGKYYGQWLCEASIFVYDFEKFDAHDILSKIQQYKITTFCAPPTMFRFFIKDGMEGYDLSSLKYATVAGEALNPEVYNKFLEYTGISLKEGFGQTETTLTIATLPGMEVKVGSMGKPTPQYKIKLVDESGKEVKVGAVGEIVIDTSESKPYGLFHEYFLDPVNTQKAWHDGLYHTGDTAWKDEDGYYWYYGRTDDLIKSSGYRIGPFEIESVLMEHPAVLECAVTAVPDPVRGQAVKATIVLTKAYKDKGDQKLVKELQDYVKKLTAPYKYPRVVEFVETLPKTISGKIRRGEIRKNSENEK